MRDEFRQCILDLASEQMCAGDDVAEKRGAMLTNELGDGVSMSRDLGHLPLVERPPHCDVLAGQKRDGRRFDRARASRRTAQTMTAVSKPHPGHSSGPARIVEPA